MYKKYINTKPNLKLEEGDEIIVFYPYDDINRKGIFKGFYKPDQYSTLLYIVQFYDGYNDNVDFINPSHHDFSIVRTLQQIADERKLERLVEKITGLGDNKTIEQLNKILENKKLNIIDKLNKISNIKLIKEDLFENKE